MGETLLVRYLPEDQEPEMVAAYEDAMRRMALKKRYYDEYYAEQPGRDESKSDKRAEAGVLVVNRRHSNQTTSRNSRHRR